MKRKWDYDLINFTGLANLACPCCPSTADNSVEGIISQAATGLTSPGISQIDAKECTKREPMSPGSGLFPNLPLSLRNDAGTTDLFSSSVAELRRKAQEHSAALWHLAHSVQQQQSKQQLKQVKPLQIPSNTSDLGKEASTCDVTSDVIKENEDEPKSAVPVIVDNDEMLNKQADQPV